VSGLAFLVEFAWWSLLTWSFVLYGVDRPDLTTFYDLPATLMNGGLSLLLGFFTAVNHLEATTKLRVATAFSFMMLGAAGVSSVGAGSDSELTFTRGVLTLTIALIHGVVSRFITHDRLQSQNRMAEVEQQRFAFRYNDKLTRKFIDWGLADRAIADDAVLDDGRVNPEARYKCPKCHTLTTWDDVYSAVRNVEKALKPNHPNWLVHAQNLTPYSRYGEALPWGSESSGIEFHPSELQDALNCSGSEAKAYIAAATKIGLVGQGNGGWPRCSECVQARAKARRPMSPRLRRKVLMRDRFTCQDCGANKGDDPDLILHVDHIEPVAAGGRDVEDNLQVLCMDCNLGKSDDNE
jgi:hypothetical protein